MESKNNLLFTHDTNTIKIVVKAIVWEDRVDDKGVESFVSTWNVVSEQEVILNDSDSDSGHVLVSIENVENEKSNQVEDKIVKVETHKSGKIDPVLTERVTKSHFVEGTFLHIPYDGEDFEVRMQGHNWDDSNDEKFYPGLVLFKKSFESMFGTNFKPNFLTLEVVKKRKETDDRTNIS